MMRLSTSGALRAGLSQASRQATTTTPMILRAAASTSAPAHAISNPTLANIEKRWEGMPLPEQAELWMALRDRMKENWNELTLQEKKAGKSCLNGATQQLHDTLRHIKPETLVVEKPRTVHPEVFEVQLIPTRVSGNETAS